MRLPQGGTTLGQSSWCLGGESSGVRPSHPSTQSLPAKIVTHPLPPVLYPFAKRRPLIHNSPFRRELAGGFAKRVRPDTKTSLDTAVTTAYRLALARTPDSSEREAMLAFIKTQTESRKGQANAEELAVRDFCHLLLCSNEFIYVD